MTEMHFSIQFVGTGNAWSKPPINYNTNAVVHFQGHTWLMDCGLLCPLGLCDMGVSQSQIEGVFISHLHGDHVSGLEELLYTNFFAYQKRIDLWLPEGLLRSHSHYEGCDIWDNCLRASMETSIHGHKKLLTLDDYANIHILRPQNPIPIYGLQCEVFHVEHVPMRPSYGIILDNRIAFTSDCSFSKKRIEKLLERGIETIFHEVTFTPAMPYNIHTSFEELAELPREIAAHMILMHYGDLSSLDDFKKAEDLGFRIAKRAIVYEF